MTTITIPNDLFQHLSLAASNLGISIEMYLQSVVEKDTIPYDDQNPITEQEWQKITDSYEDLKHNRSTIIEPHESIESHL